MKTRDSTGMRRRLYGLILVGIAVLSTLQWIDLPGISSALSGLDRQMVDSRLSSRTSPKANEVVIVDIDERSLAQHGRWPWPRSDLARLIEALGQQASVVGLDILFAERDATPQEDESLAAAIARSPAVLGYYLSSDRQGQRAGQLPEPLVSAAALERLGHHPTQWNGYGANLVKFQQAAGHAGFFNAMIDPDGVVRAVPLLAQIDGQIVESLAIAVLRRALGNDSGAATVRVVQDAVIVQGGRGRVRLPVSENMVAMVPLTATTGEARFTYVSAGEILQGSADPALWKDKVVLVGSSAPGLTDLRATAVSRTLPGVEIHAALIQEALQASQHSQGNTPLLVRSIAGRQVAAVAIGIVGAILALSLPAIGATGILLAAVVSVVLLLGLNAVGFNNLRLIIPVSAGLAVVVVLAAINLALGYLLEGRARKAVADLFGEYVAPSLVEQMMRDPARYRAMRSETRVLTVLFADIRGFTRISETMDPEDLREYINEYLTRMTEVVHQHGGTLDKYIGDAVMAFWGAPIEDAMHADHAVSAALAMVGEAAALSQRYEARGWPALTIGVGVNSGECRVGDMGSKSRRAYTVLGDTVNLASRIEGLTKHFNLPVLVGPGTRDAAQAHSFADLGLMNVAGRVEPVQVFVPSVMAVTLPLPPSGPVSKDLQHAATRIGV